MFYSWYYRLPPWMPGLCLEGEDGDYIAGPIALKRKAKEERERVAMERTNEENLVKLCVPRLAAVAARAWSGVAAPSYAEFAADQRRLLQRYAQLAGADLGETPFAASASQRGNLAFRGAVTVSAGASQPVFGPDRLTNGIPDRFIKPLPETVRAHRTPRHAPLVGRRPRE